MSIPVTVTMHSRVTLYENGSPTGDTDGTAVLFAEGRFSPDSGRLSYTERSDGGETHVVLSYPPEERDTLSVTRSGASNARFTLAEGVPATFVYEVPPFRFDACATLLSVRNRLTARGGTLSAVYRMTLGGQEEKISWNLSITPKEDHAT